MESIITTSWDDGHPKDRRISDLLEKYNIPGTFYIPIENEERELMNEESIKELSQEHEVGAHSFRHLDLTDLEEGELKDEIKKSKQKLEEITGKEITSFAYPKGKYNGSIVRTVKESGFKVARTTRLYETKPEDVFRLPVTVQTKNPARSSGRVSSYALKVLKNPFKMKDAVMNYMGEDWTETAKKYLKKVEREGGVFHLMGHSWQLEEEGFAKLEEVLKFIDNNRTSFKLVTNSELADML